MHEVRNDLLKRKEIQFHLDSAGNPGFQKAKEAVMEKFKASEDSVVISEIKSGFGSKSFLVNAFVYDSHHEKTRVERKKKVKKAAGS